MKHVTGFFGLTHLVNRRAGGSKHVTRPICCLTGQLDWRLWHS